MFGMKTKKRVKKLEEQLNQMNELCKSMEKSLGSFTYEIDRRFASLEFSVNQLQTDNIGGTTHTGASYVTVDEMKKYVDLCVNKSIEENKKIFKEIKSLLEKRDNSPKTSESDDYRKLLELYKQEHKRGDELERKLNALISYINLQKTQSVPTPEPVKPTPEPKPEPVKSTPEPKPEPVKPAQSRNSLKGKPVFTENEVQNERALNRILENSEALKSRYITLLDDNNANNVYLKTVDNCINKLQKLADKLDNPKMTASKIVNEVVKILNTTIVKNFANKSLCSAIDKFMLDCFFVKRELQVGQKLTDDDFAFIGDMPLDVPVSDKSQHNVIQSKEHDAYLICYKDEDGDAYRIIEGKYAIGIYRE